MKISYKFPRGIEIAYDLYGVLFGRREYGSYDPFYHFSDWGGALRSWYACNDSNVIGHVQRCNSLDYRFGWKMELRWSPAKH